jgi:Ankyrin repeats (3 copies)
MFLHYNSGTLLHAAAQHGKAQFVQLLVSKGTSVNAKRQQCGETALHLACVFNRAACTEALLDSGADLNSTTDVGATPALLAAVHGSTECLQLLTERGADLSIRDHAGHTVLHAAATWGRLQCVSLLLSYSKDIVADVNAVSADGSTPLMLCFRIDVPIGLTQVDAAYNMFKQDDADKCAQLLLDNGASVAKEMLTQLCARAGADSDHNYDDDDDDQHVATMRALSDYMTRLRSSVAAHTAVIAVHTEACSMSSIQQHTDTTVHTVSTSSGSSGSSASSAASTCSAAQQDSSVRVQLVHAVTGARAAKLYKLELRTLERLLAVHGSVGQHSSVLLKLLKTPPGWRPMQEQQQQCDIIELKYDGKHT